MTAPRSAESEDSASGGGAEAARGGRLRRPLRLDGLAAIGLFLAALIVRILPWNAVYHADGVFPFGNDAFYHLRRIQYSIANFPLALTFDPFLNFPHGAKPIWPPTFDWLLAALIRLLPGSERPEAVEALAMFVPPVIGALTVTLLYVFARRFYGRPSALLAAAILSFLPAHFYYSQLGFLDHHVLVALLALLMLWATMALLRAPREALATGAPTPIGQSVVLGLAMAGAVLVWPGSLIHVGIVQIALVARLLSSAEPSAAVAWSRSFAVVHLWAGVALLPFSAGNEWPRWGSFSPLVLSNFQPIYFGAAALGFGLCGALWRRGFACASRLRRALSAGLVAAVLLGGLLLAVPALLSVLIDAWSWLAKEESFQAVVNESRPLLFGRGHFGRTRAAQYLTVFLYAVPLAVGWLGWRLRDRAEQLFFVWWTLALFAATLNQWRFMNSFAITQALLIAVTLRAAVQALGPALDRTGRRKPILALAATAVGIVIVSPVVEFYRPFVAQLRASVSGEPPRIEASARSIQLVVGAARWLRDNSPPPERAGYSVLGPWGDGHILKYAAERPVVQDNFGDDVAVENFELAEAYFSARSERAGLAVLAKTKSRYVLVRSTGSGHTSGYAYDSLHSRLFHLMGTEGRAQPDDSGDGGAISALVHHRLIYESPPLRSGPGPAHSFCKLYEVVTGAELVGPANPGAQVQVVLPVRSRHGEGFYYAATTRADAAGRYALRLPYSNDRFSPDVRVGTHYSITSDGAESTVSVREAWVRTGVRIEGPSLASPATSGDADR